MADNEKNNTKIMKENFADKALDAEQLDGVAGGSVQQNKDDLAFLRNLLPEPLPDQIKDPGYAEYNWALTAQEGWAKVGVKCRAFGKNYQNQYFIGDVEVSHEEAMDYAKKVMAQRNKK